MSATTKVAAAVAAGYLLGRTKKLRLAITVGSVLAGGRLAGGVKPGALVQMLSDNPEVQRLQEQLRGQVLEAAKAAAANVATSRLEALNESLQGGKSLTDSLTSVVGQGEQGDQSDQGDEGEQSEQDQAGQGDQSDQADQQDQQEPEQHEEQDEEQERPQPQKRAAKKAPPRKRAQGAGQRTAQGAGQSASQGAGQAAKRAPRKKAAASGEGR